MRTRGWVRTATALLIAGAIGGAAAQAPADGGERPATRATMRSIYQGLSDALRASLSRGGFESPDDREEILLTLRSLSASASQLERHGEELDASYDYLRRSLARDARDAAERFDDGNYAGAQFVLLKMTENCVSCHSRTPASGDSDFAAELLQDVDFQNLPLEERVQLEVATRQFDRALDTYEQILRSMSVTASQIALMGAFEDYLAIALRVKGNPGRARAALVGFLDRSDVPLDLYHQVETWIATLPDVRLGFPKGRAVRVAKDYIERGQEQNLYPADRRGLVYFVAASSVLHRFFETQPASTDERAEAYYWLGVAESYISHSYWLSETEFYLESAIRTAPSTLHAERAFDFLVSYTASAYTGTSGYEMPRQVRERLEELRALIDES